WPPSNEGSTTIANTAPAYATVMNPISLASIPDGSTNTIGIVERVKGKRVTNRASEMNTTYTGGANSFIVNNGVVTVDNATGANACRTAKAGSKVATGTNPNEASGSMWFQYTCRWLGCANMMGQPNSPVC